MSLAQLKGEIDAYAKGKTWYWYIPAWLFALYVFFNLAFNYSLSGETVPFIISIAQSFNFFLHEMAHLAVGFLPGILVAAAGNGSELLLGLLLILGGFLGRTYFASVFGFLWFMLASYSTADYMADARAQRLPLVSFGDVSGQSSPIHDWNFIFTKLGLLEQDTLIAGMVRGVGLLAGLFGILFSGWLMYKIASFHGQPEQVSLDDEDILMKIKTVGALKPEEVEKIVSKRKGKVTLYPEAKQGRMADEPEKPPEDNKI